MDDLPSVLSACCASTTFSIGSTLPTWPARKRCTTAPACAVLWVLIWEVTHPRAGRARLWRGQAPVGIWQGALPRFAEERHKGVHRVGAGQHLPLSPKTDGTGAPMKAQSGPHGPPRSPKGAGREAVSHHFFAIAAINTPQWRFDGTYSAKP